MFIPMAIPNIHDEKMSCFLGAAEPSASAALRQQLAPLLRHDHSAKMVSLPTKKLVYKAIGNSEKVRYVLNFSAANQKLAEE